MAVFKPEQESIWKSSEFAAAFSGGMRQRFPGAQEQFEVLRSLIAGKDRPIRTFIDLGCGDGILSAMILETCPEAKGLLLDFSAPMLEIAKGRLKSRQDLSFVQADFGMSDWLDALPCVGGYDLVVSGYAIHHQDNRRKKEIYGEILQTLNNGGLFINIEHVAPAGPWCGKIHDDAFIDVLFERREDPGQTRDAVAALYHSRPDKAENILERFEVQLQWLRELGYDEVELWHKRFEFAMFGGFRNPHGIQGLSLSPE